MQEARKRSTEAGVAEILTHRGVPHVQIPIRSHPHTAREAHTPGTTHTQQPLSAMSSSRRAATGAPAAAPRSGSSSTPGSKGIRAQLKAAAAAAASSAASAVQSPADDTARMEEQEQLLQQQEEEEEQLQEEEQMQQQDAAAESAAAGSVARMERMMALMTEQLRAAQESNAAAQASNALLVQRLLASSTTGGSSSSGSSSAVDTSARVERRQQRVSTPVSLTFDAASKASALEDWFYGMELMFDQLGADADAKRLAEMRAHCHRDVYDWWTTQKEADPSAPITTWKGFKEAMRAQFLPQSERQEAMSEFMNIRQHARETMVSYLLRVAKAFARTRGLFADASAMYLVLDRVRKEEWKNTVAVAIRDVENNTITTLAQLCACLRAQALGEPGKQRSSGDGSSARTGQQKPYGGSHRRPTQVKAAAAGYTEEEEEEYHSGEDTGSAHEGETRVAAAGQREENAFLRCRRCEEKGHTAYHCTSKTEKRRCHTCKKTGHLMRECPEKRPARRGMAQLPKNA